MQNALESLSNKIEQAEERTSELEDKTFKLTKSVKDKQTTFKNKNEQSQPGAMAHTSNSSTLGGRGGWITRSTDRDHPGQNGETPSLLKIQKIRWARWRVPVIPATQEAEAGELPEPRRQMLR